MKRLPLVTGRRRLLADQLARTLVGAGGLAIIGSILAILVFILIEVLPLLKPARVSLHPNSIELREPAGAVMMDEHQSHCVVMGRSGVLEVYSVDNGQRVIDLPWSSWLEELAAELPSGVTGPAGQPTWIQVPPESSALAAATSDGWVLLRQVRWEETFDSTGNRQIRPRFAKPTGFQIDPSGSPLGVVAVDAFDPERLAAAAQLQDGSIAIVRIQAIENVFTGEIERSESRTLIDPVPTLSTLALEVEQGNLFGGTQNGELYWWRIRDEEPVSGEKQSAGLSPVTALTLLVGRRSLVVGQKDGTISIWIPATSAQNNSSDATLTRIRTFASSGHGVSALAPGWRNRTFLALDDRGELSLYFSTSERLLARLETGVAGAQSIALAPKGDGAVVAGTAVAKRVAIENPHPEASWKAFFGKIWFEGYSQPEYVWQSTGGTDDFEAKLSLTPLIVGTLKGTFYSLLVAVPLGVLGAMFASQFLHPKLLGKIKPVVEIMASLPSVILGFLAGLWLAPLLERTFVGLILALVALPITIWVTGILWSRLPLAWRQRFPEGAEVAAYLAVAAATLVVCFSYSGPFERLLFGGSFPGWLLATTGLAYDQRNAIVVGLAMGFAVIPIIFAISEDAFSNVPKSLIAGSLALGANRWQTVSRVVLPTASPGVFSAIMVGFGRAVGETMIVLMATGNTPVMDFHPFNGFRTLSANIAVEIPEAPHGGTLYRTLFLAALLLFTITFIVNTAAEIVRQNLRKRYAQL